MAAWFGGFIRLLDGVSDLRKSVQQRLMYRRVLVF
jgi:hypothetical protein